MQPTLYLLKPADVDPPVVCPESALVEGLLVYYPAILDAVAVKRIGFSRPRPELVTALGEAYQGAPVLHFPKGAKTPADAEATPEGERFLAGPNAIASYFASLGLAGRLAS